MNPERKTRWRREIDWLLSVTDHIVELVPSQQSNNGVNMEVNKSKPNYEKNPSLFISRFVQN